MSQYNTLEQKAVALKYDETENSAPVIVASGMGYVAEKTALPDRSNVLS